MNLRLLGLRIVAGLRLQQQHEGLVPVAAGKLGIKLETAPQCLLHQRRLPLELVRPLGSIELGILPACTRQRHPQRDCLSRSYHSRLARASACARRRRPACWHPICRPNMREVDPRHVGQLSRVTGSSLSICCTWAAEGVFSSAAYAESDGANVQQAIGSSRHRTITRLARCIIHLLD